MSILYILKVSTCLNGMGEHKKSSVWWGTLLLVLLVVQIVLIVNTNVEIR